MIEASSSWPALLALGAVHGINPAMGWLFAVALGLQRASRSAVWRALGPLALGHAVAIAVTVLAAGLIGGFLPPPVLKWSIAVLLVGLGGYRLARSRHIRFGGMQVDGRELAIWSFLMASSHGAGLMVLPVVFGDLPGPGASHQHVAHAAILADSTFPLVGLTVALAHTAGYLLMTGAIAVVAHEWVGLRFLRTAWVNLDLVWAAALVLAGVITLLLL